MQSSFRPTVSSVSFRKRREPKKKTLHYSQSLAAFSNAIWFPSVQKNHFHYIPSPKSTLFLSVTLFFPIQWKESMPILWCFSFFYLIKFFICLWKVAQVLLVNWHHSMHTHFISFYDFKNIFKRGKSTYSQSGWLC